MLKTVEMLKLVTKGKDTNISCRVFSSNIDSVTRLHIQTQFSNLQYASGGGTLMKKNI